MEIFECFWIFYNLNRYAIRSGLNKFFWDELIIRSLRLGYCIYSKSSNAKNVCQNKIFAFVHLIFEYEAEAAGDSENKAKDLEAWRHGPGAEAVKYDQHDIVHFDECCNGAGGTFWKCCLNERFSDGV